MFSQVGVIDPVNHVITGKGEQGFLCYGPYQTLPQGKYWVEYTLRLLNQDQKDEPGKQLGYADINVIDHQDHNSSSVFTLKDFKRHNPLTVKVKVNIPEGYPKLEYRVQQNAGNNLQLEAIKVYPADLLPGKKKSKAILVNLSILAVFILLFSIPWKKLWSIPRKRKLLLIMVVLIVAEIVLYKATSSTNMFSGRFPFYSQISSFDKKNNIHNDNKSGFLLYGPYWTLKPGNYVARFKILENTCATGDFGYVDASSLDDPRVNSSATLNTKDFTPGAEREIIVKFRVMEGQPRIELRVFSFGNNNFTVKGLKVKSLGIHDAFLLANFTLILGGLPLFIYFKKIRFKDLTTSRKMRFFVYICLAGMIISLGYHLFQSKINKYGPPHNSFLFDSLVRYGDYDQTYNYVAGLKEGKDPFAGELPAVYFPFTFIALYPLTMLSAKVSLQVFIALVSIAFLIFLFSRSRSYLFAFFTVLLSYPLFFLLDRGNIEGLLFLILALFLYLFQTKKYLLSAIVLALAISLKLYPAILLVLFLSEKRYKDFYWGMAAAAFFTFAGLLFLSSKTQIPVSDVIDHFLFSLDKFKTMYYGSRTGGFDVHFNHTFCNLIKSLNLFNPLFKDINLLIRVYNYAIAGLSLLLSWYVIKIEKTQWRKWTLLILAMIFFPNVSFDYTLINLYLPLMLFLTVPGEKDDLAFCLLFGLLLIPKHYFIIDGMFSLGTFLTPVLAIVMMVLIILSAKNERKTDLPEKLIPGCGI